MNTGKLIACSLIALALACFPACKKSGSQAANSPQPAAAPAPPPPPCQTKIVITALGHSRTGFSVADFSLTDLDGAPVGQELPEGTPVPESANKCDESTRGENTVSATPKMLQLCDPEEKPYLLHVTGKEQGLFDVEVRPESTAPVANPALLCNYAVDSDKKYDWVFRFATKPKPIVFVLGSKDDPGVQQQLKALERQR